MSSVNVDYDNLIMFKETLDRNAAHFDEIRQNIGSTINAIRETEWQDPKADEFREVFFSQSDPDLTRLVETMVGFSTYLQGKIEILQRFHANNISF